jgi:hypothetical protein
MADARFMTMVEAPQHFRVEMTFSTMRSILDASETCNIKKFLDDLNPEKLLENMKAQDATYSFFITAVNEHQDFVRRNIVIQTISIQPKNIKHHLHGEFLKYIHDSNWTLNHICVHSVSICFYM